MKYTLSLLITIFAVNSHAIDRYTIANLVDKIQPSVVSIKAEESTVEKTANNKNPFDKRLVEKNNFENEKTIKSKPSYNIGSGVIISKDGYLITNYHVVELADKIKITTIDNKFYSAKLIGFDVKSDLALLKLNTTEDIKFSNLADSNKARVGELVIAIGNPYGLDGSVSTGIISARNRNIGTNIYDDFLQTDASINPGNSGGPLFNLDGDVVGINTAIFSKTGGSNGIGFAIPSNTVSLIIKQLKESGTVTRGWLGIQAQQLDEETSKALKLKDTNGVLVSEISSNSPAALAGIKVGDVIVMYNGKTITSLFDLPKMVAETPINTRAELEVLRNGLDIKLVAKIVSQDEVADDNTEKNNGIIIKQRKILGFYVAENTKHIAKELRIDKITGVVVTEVEKQFKKYNVIPGDIILQADQKPINTTGDLNKMINSTEKESILLLINRRGENIFSVVKR